MNQFAVSQTDFLDVRRIDDQFSVIGQHGFQLVYTSPTPVCDIGGAQERMV